MHAVAITEHTNRPYDEARSQESAAFEAVVCLPCCDLHISSCDMLNRDSAHVMRLQSAYQELLLHQTDGFVCVALLDSLACFVYLLVLLDCVVVPCMLAAVDVCWQRKCLAVPP
jgi:hypothetical protein